MSTLRPYLSFCVQFLLFFCCNFKKNLKHLKKVVKKRRRGICAVLQNNAQIADFHEYNSRFKVLIAKSSNLFFKFSHVRLLFIP